VRRGEVARLQITGIPKKGYHTYPVTKRSSAQDTAGLTRLKFGESKGLVPLWPIQESEPEPVDEGPVIGVYLEHEMPFTLSQDVLVLRDAPPGLNVLPIQIQTQVCDKNNCYPTKVSLKAEVEVTDEPPLPVSRELVSRMDEKSPDITVISVKPPKDHATESASQKTAKLDMASAGLINSSHEEYKAGMDDILDRLVHKDEKMPLDLIAFILAGVFWGGVSLITPCVFPMIPITVSFFLKQSEKEHHKPITMAIVYSATIVLVLTLAAAFLLSAFRWLSINPIMNYGLGALFIFFALSLFGMYDIELPSGLARFTSSKEGKGGMVGTIFMALTFTIISFACVAPFLGGFGGTAGTMARPWWHNILGGLAFSATFASPFFLLALFPTLLRKMPKSGSWLNSVKVVMGFLELAAAFKFFRAAELVQSTAVTFFTFDLVLGVWIALCVLAGLYLLGVYRLPHDSPEEYIGVPSLLFAGIFLGLGVYLMPALFKINAEGEAQRPTGTIYAWVDSFLLPDVHSGKEIKATGNLAYAVAQAQEIRQRTGKTQRIFLDFTGKVCTNCRINERNVFSKSEFQKLFQNYIVAQIYTDVVPADLYSPELRAKFDDDSSRLDADALQVNQIFEKKAFGTTQLPLYVVLEPQTDGKIAVLGPYGEGLINNEAAFAEFLRDPK
ncbi:MAG TPA: cytochrome c biogenesis protein CcdA, partial [Gemmataceae bacterium]|nr:cytochrome c biogenesis protein CcdA [Gemmataceae bacterium]